VAVMRNATQDRDRKRWLVGVVCEAVPLALRDEDEVASLETHRLALAQMEACTFEDEEILLGVRMAVELVPAVGRELGDVEHRRLRSAVVSVGKPVHVHPFPTRPLRNG